MNKRTEHEPAKPEQDHDVDRRSLLKLAGVGVAALGLPVVNSSLAKDQTMKTVQTIFITAVK